MPQCKSTTFQLAAIMWQKCPLREPQPPQRTQNPKRDTKPPPKPLLNWRRKKLCEQKLCQTLNTTCACQAIQLKRLFAPKETCKVFANRQNSFLIQLEIAQTHYIELKHSSRKNGQISPKIGHRVDVEPGKRPMLKENLVLQRPSGFCQNLPNIWESVSAQTPEVHLQIFWHKWSVKIKKGQQFSCKLTFSILPQNPC